MLLNNMVSKWDVGRMRELSWTFGEWVSGALAGWESWVERLVSECVGSWASACVGSWVSELVWDWVYESDSEWLSVA